MKKSPDPKAPIVITSGKPKAKSPAKPKRPKKHKLEPGQHPAEVSPVFTTQQMRVLDLLATGSSMAAAAEAVSRTHWALQKWMQRDKVFRYYADRARGIHTSDIYDAFHEVETDARVFLQEVIRDHDVKPHIRLRAALAALNRKTEDWLPRPIFLATPFIPPTISDTNDQSSPAIDANSDSDETNGAANANSPQRAETEPSSSGEGPGSRLDYAECQWQTNTHLAINHADKIATHLRGERETGEQSDAVHVDIETGEQSETARIDIVNGERSDAAQSPKGASIDSPGRSERSEREPGEKQPSEARPPQPPVAQNTPITTVADDSDSSDTKTEPSFSGSEPQTTTRMASDHADKNATYADKTENLHLTANQSLPLETPNFCPPKIFANADKTSPDTAQAEARPLGWAHNETSRSRNAENNAAHGDIEAGEQSDAAKSPQGASMDSPGRSERSERQPGEELPSEARPPQPPIAQNTPGTTVADNSDSCDTETEPSSLGEGPGSRLDHANGQPPIYVADHADKNATQADKTKTLHLTANQSLPSKTPNFCPPKISANADKSSPETAPTEARPLGWAHNETPRSRYADTNAAHIDDIPGPAIPAPLRSRPKANPLPPAPDPGEDVTMRLDTAFFTKYTVLRHESAEDFAHLLRELTSIYEPQAKAEELQVLRIAQAHWNLRRIDTMQAAVLDSTVSQIQCAIPDVHPAAAIATTFLGKDPSDQVWFLDRMHHYRKFHDEYLERQENRLFHLQERRAYAPIRKAKLALLQPRRQEIGPFPTRQARLTHLADASFRYQLATNEAQCKRTHGENRD